MIMDVKLPAGFFNILETPVKWEYINEMDGF
jgi:hypothetical protein